MSRIWLVWLVMAGLLLAAAPAWSDDERNDLDALIKKLQDENPDVQNRALRDIMFSCRASLPALPYLTEIARKSTKENRLKAFKLLGEYGPEGQAAMLRLREAITDNDIEIRIQAAYALLRISPKEEAAVRVLAAALHDAAVGNRRLAATNLGRIGFATINAAAELIEATSDKDVEVRTAVAKALGKIGPNPVEPARQALRRLLTDESIKVRVVAAQSLWQLDEPAQAILTALVKLVEEYKRAHKPDQYPAILNSDNPAYMAVSLMGEIGPEAKTAIPTLVAAMDAELQFAVVDALGRIGPDAEPAIERLAKALRDTKVHSFPFVHHAWCLSDDAATALRNIGPASRTVLLTALDDQDERVRANAASALGYLPLDEAKTVPALIERLEDKNEPVRAIAAFSLGRLKAPGPKAASALAARLNDTGEWLSAPGSGIAQRFSVGGHVVNALGRIKPPAKTLMPTIVQLLKNSKRIEEPLLTILRQLGPDAVDAVPVLVPLLDDPQQRLAAALALSRIAPEQAGLFEVFRDALADREQKWGADAARGLADLGRRATPLIPNLYAEIQLLKDKPTWNERERAYVAAAILRLDRQQSKAAQELVTAVLETNQNFWNPGHEDEAIAMWVSLGITDKPAIELLVKGLKYEPPEPRKDYYWQSHRTARHRLCSAELLLDVSAEIPTVVDALVDLCASGYSGPAADAIGRIGPAAEKAIPALITMLGDNERYTVGGDFYGNGGTERFPGEQASLALSKIGPAAVPTLRAALTHVLPAVRQRASQALGAIGPPARAAAPDLVGLFKDERRVVRAAAAEAVGNLGDTSEPTIVGLRSLLTDKHLVVRVSAAKGLGQLGPAVRSAAAELATLQKEPFHSARTAASEALRKIQ